VRQVIEVHELLDSDVLYSADQIRGLMDKPTNIRNMSVIAHGEVSHLPLPYLQLNDCP
jgi:hypothetical protein